MAQPNGNTGFHITCTELVWPGKYNEDGSRKEVPRVSLPFQVIETINESRATREASRIPPREQAFAHAVGDGPEVVAGVFNAADGPAFVTTVSG